MIRINLDNFQYPNKISTFIYNIYYKSKSTLFDNSYKLEKANNKDKYKKYQL